MLSQNQVVRIRQSIEKHYDHTCTISGMVEHINADHTTSTKLTKIVDSQPCRISFKAIDVVNERDMSYQTVQTVKLFIAPEISVPEGSTITVVHDGITDEYSATGKPAVYPTHQEIIMKPVKHYA